MFFFDFCMFEERIVGLLGGVWYMFKMFVRDGKNRVNSFRKFKLIGLIGLKKWIWYG